MLYALITTTSLLLLLRGRDVQAINIACLNNVALIGTPDSTCNYRVFTAAFSRIFSACIKRINKLSNNSYAGLISCLQSRLYVVSPFALNWCHYTTGDKKMSIYLLHFFYFFYLILLFYGFTKQSLTFVCVYFVSFFNVEIHCLFCFCFLIWL